MCRFFRSIYGVRTEFCVGCIYICNRLKYTKEFFMMEKGFYAHLHQPSVFHSMCLLV